MNERSRSYENASQRAALQIESTSVGDVCFLTDRGGRSENQDAWGACESVAGTQVYAVADGLGGHQGGRIAAQAAIEGILNYAQAQTQSLLNHESLTALFAHAQASIREQQNQFPTLESMRSTLVVLVIEAGQAVWAHVGDVRLYLMRNHKIEFQTKDQSVPQLMVDTGEIAAEDIRQHPDRSRLLQALGKPDDQYKIAFQAEPKQLASDDQFILCTDGFWEWVIENEMLAALEKETVEQATEILERTLQSRAQSEEDDFDNYTFLLIRCSKIESEPSKWSATRLVSSFFKPKVNRRSS
ncbi:Serine/threonine protein phosphatase PrpC [Idiomarinaceae bacterium HL-53]|nr:Serine/threonine protein phosphatase PrpC [Idiomarinaceae bacterium HL-53]